MAKRAYKKDSDPTHIDYLQEISVCLDQDPNQRFESVHRLDPLDRDRYSGLIDVCAQKISGLRPTSEYTGSKQHFRSNSYLPSRCTPCKITLNGQHYFTRIPLTNSSNLFKISQPGYIATVALLTSLYLRLRYDSDDD